MWVSAIEGIIAAGAGYCKGAVERRFHPGYLRLMIRRYAVLEALIRDLGLIDVASGGADGFFNSSVCDSPMPSRMLEQLAQILGLRERTFPPTAIG
jgi:hypothetical protein